MYQRISDDLYSVSINGCTEYTNKTNIERKKAGENFASWKTTRKVPKSNLSEDMLVDGIDKGKKYLMTVRNRHTGEEIEVDTYDLLEALKLTCPAMSHAFKKVTMAGKRGTKSYDKDCDEAINSIEQSKLLQKWR